MEDSIKRFDESELQAEIIVKILPSGTKIMEIHQKRIGGDHALYELVGFMNHVFDEDGW